MNKFNNKQAIYAVSTFLLVTVAGLWSWNTLSELFNFPQAHYKHVLATFIILLILKRCFFSSNISGDCDRGEQNEFPDH